MKLPRFSLRELFLLVVIASMGCGWWVADRRAAESYPWRGRAGALEALLRQAGWDVAWDFQRDQVCGRNNEGGVFWLVTSAYQPSVNDQGEQNPFIENDP